MDVTIKGYSLRNIHFSNDNRWIFSFLSIIFSYIYPRQDLNNTAITALYGVGRRDHHHMVVGFMTTHAISAYH
jgi:hypothetical protein